MSLMKTARFLLVAFGALGVFIAQIAPLHAVDRVAGGATIQDLALADGGTLRGQVVDQNGQHQRDLLVTISQRGEALAQTKTNAEGRFAVRGLRGGVYVITAGHDSTVVRAWSANAAPPAASSETLLVTSDLTVRGKHHGKGGKGGAGSGGFAGGASGWALLLAAGAAAAGIAIAVANDDGS